MKDLIIAGSSSFSKLLYHYVTEYGNRKVAAFSVDQIYIMTDEDRCLMGINVVPFENIEKEFPPENHEIILGIGYSKMNQVRRDIFLKYKKKGYMFASFIHPTALIAKEVEMGEGNIVLEHSIIQPFVTIGNGNLIWEDVKLSHDNKIGNFNTLAQNVSISGMSCIGDNCFLGNSCTILNGIKIADYTLAGAGTIVKRNTNPYEVIVPARSISLEGKKSTEYL